MLLTKPFAADRTLSGARSRLITTHPDRRATPACDIYKHYEGMANPGFENNMIIKCMSSEQFGQQAFIVQLTFFRDDLTNLSTVSTGRFPMFL
jgi:hypothetical protein